MFKEAVKIILKHEGGYVNDKDDPGGETKFGISKKAFPYLNIKEITIQDAEDIYYEHYWKKAKGVKTDIDGVIGPKTIGNSIKSGLEPKRLRSYRVKYYALLVTKKPTLGKYWYGWYTRAIAV